MSNNSTKTIAILLIGLTSSFSAPAMAEEVTSRAECRKTHTGGCTAWGDNSYTAPSGKYIKRAHQLPVGTIINHLGVKPLCREPIASTSVTRTFPNSDAEATFYTAIRLRPYQESGSGIGGLNQVYFVNCKYEFQLGTLPD
ncbi:hypothetical protein [Yoonia sp. SDW83-1]|uniref:hypothetical protein n=1 Tax=Yoonia sp. SDW83-1 TaxID=3366945 RepID=UPI00398C3410